MNDKIALIMPPFFSPWTPPLGISVLKSYLEQYGCQVKCYDFNTDATLWGTHHTYFAGLQRLEASLNTGYSKLWWVLNAHMLAYISNPDPTACSRVLSQIIPLYRLRGNQEVIGELISIVKQYFMKLGELIDRFDFSDYRVVGTSTYTTSLASALFTLKRIKQKCPQVITVMGGGVFVDDLAPGSYNLNVLLTECPFVDHVVVGEGELLFLKLIRGELDKRLISIADIEGKTLSLPESVLPDFSGLDLKLYYHLTIEGGRSCPFQCRFCSETVQWGPYRKKPMDLFAKQVMALAQKWGNKTFFLADSLINPYIASFSRELLASKADILYDGYLRADKLVMDSSEVKLWARSGLYRVRLGLESGSAHMLKVMDKRTTPATCSQALKSLATAGIRTTTYWVVGFPGETEDDFAETLRFIQEHHRFIYELEAHPYIYYPEGQVGSNQTAGYSLYPDEVTEIIRFKRWEVKSDGPTREETYERLKRLSHFAADLGLPNIYTMTERYQAENRWQRLHPLAREVYKGTLAHRAKVDISTHPGYAFINQPKERLKKKVMEEATILCYQAHVQCKLSEAVLSAAVDRLVEYNDVLQMCLQLEAHASQAQDPGSPGAGTLFRCFYEGAHADEQVLEKRQIVVGLATKMSQGRETLVKVALFLDDQSSSSEVFLLASQSIADGKSIGLLFEDLFRIYEQLSENREASLPPVQRIYADLLGEWEAADPVEAKIQGYAALPCSQAGKSETSHATKLSIVSLARDLWQRMSSAVLISCGLGPDKVLASGLLKSLDRVAEAGIIGIDITVDDRTTETSLQRMVGPLTRIVYLPTAAITADQLVSWCAAHQTLHPRDIRSSYRESLFSADQAAGAEKKVLANFACFFEEPWLGGAEWVPQGFVIVQERPLGSYSLEIVPLLSDEGIKIYLKYRDDPEAKGWVEMIKSHLSQDVEAALADCQRYSAARQFWWAEFGQQLPKSIGEALTGKGCNILARKNQWATTDCRLDGLMLNSVQKKLGLSAPQVILALYGFLLSRLSGLQDLALLVCDDNQRAFPLRVSPSWSLHFKEFAHHVHEKMRLATAHQLYAFHVLRALGTLEQGTAPPVFGAGYVFGEASPRQEENLLELALASYPDIKEQVGIILEVQSHGEECDLRCRYPQELFTRESVASLLEHLTVILKKVNDNPDIPLGYIVLERHQSKQ